VLSAQKRAAVLNLLNAEFPSPKPPLHFSNPFELMVAVMLSAQCTDERVNRVTPSFFPTHNTPLKMLQLGEETLRAKIRSCGYFNQKAKNIIKASQKLIEKYHGEIPQSLEDLTSLPGVGLKSAGVVLSQAFAIPAFPVDTHVFRVANRIGLVHEKTRDKTAYALEKTLPQDCWIDFHLQLIFHGRKTCKSQKPRCYECPVKDLCEYKKKNLVPQNTKKAYVKSS